jgi:hypothetical protein
MTVMESGRTATAAGLALPHHDGSDLFVVERPDEPGGKATLRVRVPAAAGVERVFLRYVRDGEPKAVAAEPDEETASETWFLARHLGRPGAWPAGDLALRKVVQALYGDVDVRAAGARFDPFQNLTAHYLLAQFLNP